MKDSDLKLVLEMVLLQLENIALGLPIDADKIKPCREVLNG